MAKQPQNPCSECPFRKNSVRGYLGPHESFREIKAGLDAGFKFPCHMEVNKIAETNPRKDLVEVGIEAKHCTGALHFMNNTMRASRSRAIYQLQQEVKDSPTRSTVFQSDKEAHDYHDTPMFQAARDRVNGKEPCTGKKDPASSTSPAQDKAKRSPTSRSKKAGRSSAGTKKEPTN